MNKSFVEHSQQFQSGKDSPVNILQKNLAMIERRESEVKAFMTLADSDELLAQARASEARWRANTQLSPLDGATVAIKDIIETRDMPTGQGSPLWENFHSRRDSATVQALRAGGAIILGKTTSTEFAATEVYHATTNPNDPGRTPGGSSSGSAAAVASGMSTVALGSQVVGSTLRPASFCGCVGFKPTFGALNRGGTYDNLSQSCVGLFGRSITDVWALAQMLASRVGGDPGHMPLQGTVSLPVARAPKRLVILQTDGWRVADPASRKEFEAQVQKLRAAGVECVGREDNVLISAVEDAIKDVMQLTIRLTAWESLWPLGGYVAECPEKISEAMHNRLAQATKLTRADYVSDLKTRADIRAKYHELQESFDGVIALSATGVAPVGLSVNGSPAMNVPASLLGVPALSLPELSDQNLPLGLQVIGWQGGDDVVFSLANWIQRLNRGKMTEPSPDRINRQYQTAANNVGLTTIN